MNEWVGENDGIKYGRIFSYTVKANIHDPNCSHVSHSYCTNYTLSIQIGLLDFLWIHGDVYKGGFYFIFSNNSLFSFFFVPK